MRNLLCEGLSLAFTSLLPRLTHQFSYTQGGGRDYKVTLVEAVVTVDPDQSGGKSCHH
jgi:hypothetical protein